MNLNVTRFIDDKIKQIRNETQDKGALVATSGGVDSMVCAVLAHKALGKKAIILFIDDGLMRVSDEKRVRQELEPFGIKIRVLRVANQFFKALKDKCAVVALSLASTLLELSRYILLTDVSKSPAVLPIPANLASSIHSLTISTPSLPRSTMRLSKPSMCLYLKGPSAIPK